MKLINYNYTIINTAGQWTPVLEDNFNPKEKVKISCELMSQLPLAGQVAFTDQADYIPTTSMMGDELSINGTLASCYYIATQKKLSYVKFKTSSIKQVLAGKVTSNTTSVLFPKSIVISVSKSEVILSGIKYQLTCTPPNLSQAKIYCGQNPAAGFILYNNNRIIPYVYVRATNTLIQESACGSASLLLFTFRLLSNFPAVKRNDMYTRYFKRI